MTIKSRKSTSLFGTCENCNSIVFTKDTCVHEAECPPSKEKWSHNYIDNNVLYTAVEAYAPKELPKNITDQNTHNMVFMSETAMQLCQIAIGERVMIVSQDDSIARIAWPTSHNNLSICLTKMTIEGSKLGGLVRVQKFTKQLCFAKEMIIEFASKTVLPTITPELQVSLKCLNERKAFCVGNKIHVPYYGKHLTFKIIKIIGDRETKPLALDIETGMEQMNVDDLPEFYESLYLTKWTVVKNEEKKMTVIPRITIKQVGGYQQLMQDLQDVADVILGKYKNAIAGFEMSKCVLLHGSTGVGKTTIANAFVSNNEVDFFTLNMSNMNSGDADKKLKKLFHQAKEQAPSIIMIEDIDMLCPKKSSGGSESERRLIATLIQEIDDLQSNKASTMLLVTTSKIDAIGDSLRRPGRIDQEFEICVPTPRMRRDILEKLLSRIDNEIRENELEHISFHTHGFVAADLHRLCNCAAMQTIKRHKQYGNVSENIRVSAADFNDALLLVKPSAMKGFSVEVPNVKWSDIGGQESLKLELKEAVELPLTHPEAFARLGIKPPKGILMYGPPGCSKTMIAKALATESKLNFFNIKCSEIYSKWVGESEKAVREVFRKAQQVAPSIIFVDEIDSLGVERANGNASDSGNNVQERVLTELLTELDGVTTLGNVIFVAATNRLDKLDKALLRPGRFDRIIYVPLPDFGTRLDIFQINFAKMPVAKDVDIQELTRLTEGYSGAEVQAICYQAGIKALRREITADTITKDDFDFALSKISRGTSPATLKMFESYQSNK